MKKINLFLLMTLMSWQVFSQVSVGNGVGYNVNIGPVTPFFDYSYHQIIYKAVDINASGEITGLNFEMYDSNDIPTASDNIDVWIGHTDKSAFESTTDWIDVSSLTQVMTNATITKTGHTVNFSFNTPFEYNGAQNLIIVFDENKEAGSYESNDMFSNSTDNSGDNISLYYNNYNNNPDPSSPPTGTFSDKFPNISFLGLTEICPTPTNLSIANITDHSANLQWTESASSTSYKLAFGKIGFPESFDTIASLNTTFILIDTLSPSTTYKFSVQSVCSESESSNWTEPFSFTTPCASITPGYETGFPNVLPSCWTRAGGELENGPIEPAASNFYSKWRGDRGFTNASGETVSSYAISLWESNSTRQWLISPSFDLPTTPFYQLKVNLALTSYTDYGTSTASDTENMDSDDEVQLLISQDNGATWNNLETWNASNQPAVTGTEYIYNLSEYTGEVTFALFASDGMVGESDLDFHIGGFAIKTPSSCPEPSGLTVNNITTNSATLSWTENGESSTWFIELGEQGFQQGNGTIFNAETTAELNIENLLSESNYQFYVRSFCSEDDSSSWTGPYSFSTLISCPTPSSLEANNITSTTADLSWTSNGSETSWTIEYGLNGFTQGEGTSIESIDANPYTLENLTPASSYQLYVRANCNINELSAWVGPKNFTTACIEVIEPEYIANFENSPPSCWTEAGNGDLEEGPLGILSDWRANRAFTDTAGNVIASNTVNLFGNNQKEWLFTPNINLSSGTYEVSVITAVTEWTESGVSETNDNATMGVDDEVQLLISEDNGQTWQNLTTWNTSNQPEATGTKYVHNLSAYTGTVKFAIWATDGDIEESDSHDYDFHIGHFEIKTSTTNPCNVPSNISTLDITTNSAVLSWTENGQANSWNIEYGDAGFTQGQGTQVTVTNNPFTLENLNPETEYNFYVQSICDNNNTSEWSSVNSFTTSETNIECIVPSNLNTNNITGSSAILSWTENGQATSWNIEYGLGGFTQGQGTQITVTNNPFTLENLDNETVYNLYVQSICGDNNSNWSNVKTFTTNTCSDFYGVPYTAEFGINTPICWLDSKGGELNEGPQFGDISTWRGDRSFTNEMGNALSSTCVNLYNTHHREWLVSPLINLGEGSSNLTLKTTVAVTSYEQFGNSPLTANANMGSDDQVYLLISDNNGTSWTEIDVWNAQNQPTATGTEQSFNLSSYHGEVKFALFATDGTVDDASDYDFHLGQFEIMNSTTTNLISSNHQLSYYPNPLKDELTIKADDIINSVEIYSLNNSLLYKNQFYNKEVKINFNKWHAGTYLVRTITNHKVKNFKVIKK